jgi:caffeoyl-CoA O-methyltransferase
MAIERLVVDGALAAHVDAANAMPPHVAARAAAQADHPRAVMMTHPDVGRLLWTLAAASGGTALEIGTFVGISAAWIADGLPPGGVLDTLDVDAETAADTRAWLDGTPTGERVRIHVGPALETLAGLAEAAYGLCYVDADKTAYPEYLEEAVRVVRPGGWIVADNVLSGGRIADPAADDPSVEAMRRFTRAAFDHPRLRTVLLPVGDGVTLSLRD